MTIHQQAPTNLGDFLEFRNSLAEPVAIAINFLKWLDPNGWHNLVAIHPETEVTTGRTFAPGQWDEIAAWISAHSGTHNCYYSLNEPKPGASHKKLAADDIIAIRAIGGDIDLPGANLDADLEALRVELERKFHEALPPTMLVESGGGFQPIWKLVDKLPLADDAQRDEQKTAAENQGRGVTEMFGGDHVHDICRILRLPGTLNIPNEKKRNRGRVERRAAVIRLDSSPLYTLDELASRIPPIAAHAKECSPDIDAFVRKATDEIDIREVQGAYEFKDLPIDLQEKFKSAYHANPKLAALWDGDKSALLGEDATGSGWRGSLAKLLGGDRAHNFSAMDYAQLAYIWPPAAGLLEFDEPKLHRQLARDWGRMGYPETRQAVTDKWFQRLLEAPQEPLVFHVQEAGRNDVFEFLTIGDIANRPDPKYLVDRHVPENSLGFIYAMSGAGKTFLALDIALSIAFRVPSWHGDVIQAPDGATVIYIAGEGVSGLKARIAAWKHRHGISPSQEGRFRLLPHAVNMMLPEQIEKLTRSIRRGVEGPVAAIFIDTVSRAIPGADENLQKEMSKFIEACDTVKRVAGSAVIGIHHTNKAGDMRGSGVLDGGLDFIFKLTRAKGASIGKLYCEKMKDGPDGWHNNYSFDDVTTSEGQASLVPTRVGDCDVGRGELTPELTEDVFRAMDKAWKEGKPWALSAQSKDRCASRRMVQDFGFSADKAEETLSIWEGSGLIVTDILSSKTKRKGLRVVNSVVLKGAADGSAFD